MFIPGRKLLRVFFIVFIVYLGEWELLHTGLIIIKPLRDNFIPNADGHKL